VYSITFVSFFRILVFVFCLQVFFEDYVLTFMYEFKCKVILFRVAIFKRNRKYNFCFYIFLLKQKDKLHHCSCIEEYSSIVLKNLCTFLSPLLHILFLIFFYFNKRLIQNKLYNFEFIHISTFNSLLTE
jgi:hypothetical protein